MKMVVPEKPCHLFQLLSFISTSGKFLIFLEGLGKCHRQFALYALHTHFAVSVLLCWSALSCNKTFTDTHSSFRNVYSSSSVK